MRRLPLTTALIAVGVTFIGGATASATVKPDMIARSFSSNPFTMGRHPQPTTLWSTVQAARLATAKYATNLPLAKANGYEIITKYFPSMGYHYMDPKVSGFDLSKPQILVYEHTGNGWQLGALEWVFTSKPATPPLPGATYGTFGAACHYVDGSFVYASAEPQCAPTNPQTGARFNFWHPELITLHFWVWYPNPAGIYSSMNPLVASLN